MQNLPSPLPQPEPHRLSVLAPRLLPSAVQVVPSRSEAQRRERSSRGEECSSCLTLSPGPQSGLRDRPVLCQQPGAGTDVEPGRMVSAALAEIHFPRCSGRKMWPLRHPSAPQRSGKQASFSENSLELSPAQQASRGGWEAGRKHWDAFPGRPRGGTLGGVTHTLKKQS